MLGTAYLFLICGGAYALDVPRLRGRINDLAGLLSQAQTTSLENRLAQFEHETGHQIAVLTVPSLDGDTLEDFSIRVATTWKIGHQGNDNGVLLLIARDDRRIRIEVGYGLEGVLPDAVANRIIRQVIVPRFRDQDFFGGVEAAVSAITQATRGEPFSVPSPTSKGSTNLPLSTIFILLMGTALLGSTIGFVQPSQVRGALNGAFVSGLIGLPAIFAVGVGIWMIAIFVGALASILTVKFTQRIWGRSWNVRPPQYYDISPRDTFRTGYGGLGSGGGGTSGSAGSGAPGGFSGGGGGFGGGGASGGW
jgi:uncharacterized protein